MTHASFLEENNRALSILGANVIETAVSFQLLAKDIDISSKNLNRRIDEISKVESSCTVDGLPLGLQKVVRVLPKTNSSAPAVVCGAFRAIFGAIDIDTANCDAAGNMFWTLHGAKVGDALPLRVCELNFSGSRQRKQESFSCARGKRSPRTKEIESAQRGREHDTERKARGWR